MTKDHFAKSNTANVRLCLISVVSINLHNTM